MKDLSLHMLDIAQNSLRAGANNITIKVEENEKGNFIMFSIADDGCGMDKETLEKVRDPFYTTRTTRKVGLGLAFLEQMTTSCGGYLDIESTPGKGTYIKAVFKGDHIDTPAMGDIPATLTAFFAGTANKTVEYVHTKNTRSFSINTKDIMEVLDGVSLNHPAVLKQLREIFHYNINNL